MIAAGYFGAIYPAQYGPEVGVVVAPDVAVGSGGGWVREDELERFEKLFRNKGKIRAVASPGVALLDATVTNPYRARELPEIARPKYVVVPAVVTAVSARIMCTGQPGQASLVGAVGIGTEDFDYVRKLVEDATRLGLWETSWEDF